mgnify:CR=1 FL=1
MESRSVSFQTTGEFVTRIARSWYWDEGKPWATVEELLLACMSGTNQSREELVELARKVVYGKARFIGSTADGSYALTDDDKDLVSENLESLRSRIEKLKEENEELTERYAILVDYLYDHGYEYIVRRAGIETGDDSTMMTPELESYLEQRKIEDQGIEDNYGWLSPSGEFFPVDWGNHQAWAHKKVLELGLIGNDEAWANSRGETRCARIGDEGDILVDHGWVLLHNPSMGIAIAHASPTKRLTSAQKEFLFGYYTDRGQNAIAAGYLDL